MNKHVKNRFKKKKYKKPFALSLSKGLLERILILLLCIITPSFLFAPPFYRTRSQSTNTARRLINDTLIYPNYPLCIEDTYTSFHAYAVFGTTFQFEPIVRSLFAPELIPQNGRQVIQITGSNVTDRCEKDWLADYFGLGQSFRSNISFEPLIQTYTLEPDLFLGLNNVCGGMYMRIIAPIVHVSFDLGPLEHNVQQACSGDYPAGYFSDIRVDYTQVEDNSAPPGVLCSDLLCRFSQYISQGLTPNLVTPNNATSFEALRYARFARDRLRKTHVSDIHVNFGINWIRDCYSHFATELFVAIPTGNRPEGLYVFEPLVGNGHHWEVGGVLDAHYQLWRNNCTDRELTIYARVAISHLFATRHQRALDLNNGAFSRYMLAKNMGMPTINLQAGEDGTFTIPNPNAQFKGIFSPVANLTTTDVNVSINAQVDGSILLNYRSGDFNGSVGYNYWHRNAETLSLSECGCTGLSSNQWALKGDSYTYGFVIFDENLDEEIRNLPVPLSSTQSKATIHGGTNATNANNGVDNAEFAWLTEDIPLVIEPGEIDPEEQQRTSLQPILLSEEDLNLCTSIVSKGFTHKLFLSLNHVWNEKIDYIPYIGFGVMVEHAPELNSDTGTYTDKPENSAPSQFKLWLTAGFNH